MRRDEEDSRLVIEGAQEEGRRAGRPWRTRGARRRSRLVAAVGALSLVGASLVAAGAFGGGPTAGAAAEHAATAFSSGGQHACGVSPTNRLYCWGDNSYGQLGDGAYTNTRLPVEVKTPAGTGAFTNVTGVSAGAGVTCATVSTGDLYCWGYNNEGQLGDGTWTSSDLPVLVEAPSGTAGPLSTVTGVSAGYHSACATVSSGHAYCWGDNAYGQLGDGGSTTSGNNRPVEVKTPAGTGFLSTVTGVSAGYLFACATVSSGHAYCWGRNNDGQLGNGTITDSDLPVEVKTPAGTGFLSTVTGVSAGRDIACAAVSSHHLYCWGSNGYGELGDGTTTTSRLPVEVKTPAGTGFLSTVTGVSVGTWTTCAAVSSVHLYCWGDNSYGQLGDGTTTTSHLPVEVKTPAGAGVLSTATAVSEGTSTTCAIVSSGHLYCWGYNGYGELGDGTTTTSHLPVEVKTPAGTGSLNVLSPPGAPTGVSATAGDAQATVSWTAPATTGGSPISSYTATSTPGGLTCTTSSTSCTATGLTNGTSYTFSVVATNALGTGPASSPSNSVTPSPSPTITSLTPTSGPATGGTLVTITGTNLTGASSVTFGGTAGTIRSDSSSQISAKAPAHAAGSVAVAVTTSHGSATAPVDFTYEKTPSLSATDTAANCNLEPVEGGPVTTCTVRLSIATDATDGYSVSAWATPLSSTQGAVFSAASLTGSLTLSPDAFGARAALSASGDGATLSAAYLTTRWVGYETSSPGKVVASSAHETGTTGRAYDVLTLTDGTKVDGAQAPGLYGATITYVVTPNY